MINLLLVDDHTITRTAIRRLLVEVKEFQVVSEAKNGIEAIECVSKMAIDVVLMDIKMPDMDGFEATRRLLEIEPQLKIIVLSAFSDKAFIDKLIGMGAKGYLSKNSSVDAIISAIHQVNAGQCYIDAELITQLSLKQGQSKDTNSASPFASLSNREREVAVYLIEGHKLGKIADALGISVNTVSTFRSRLFQKLGVSDNVALLQLALQNGMLNNPIINDKKADSSK